MIGAVYSKDAALIRKLIELVSGASLIDDPRVLAALYQTGQKDLLVSILLDLRQKLPEKQTQIDEYLKQI